MSDNYEARRQRRLEKLGTNEPRCTLCSCDRWQALELHHIADHRKDEQTVILCRNCHRVASDMQDDHPMHGPVADPWLEQIGRFLRGLADLFFLIAERLIEFGEALILRAQSQAGEIA